MGREKGGITHIVDAVAGGSEVADDADDTRKLFDGEIHRGRIVSHNVESERGESILWTTSTSP